jgi:FixJ family two-component response regulator
MGDLDPRVFVVDDDQSVRTGLANLLATEDYAVEMFASADEYLARVPHPGPVCLVLDVQLPGLNGLALQRQLRRKAGWNASFSSPGTAIYRWGSGR